jgi:ABC-2 type transport system ATP-binding protein
MLRPDIIVVDRLAKRYGRRSAVRGVSFLIGEGEVIGLLGPNGSGKSTVLRILTGYLPPSSGSVRILGKDISEHALEIRKYIGYVPEDSPLYDGMRVCEFLNFMARIKGMASHAVPGAVAAACQKLDLQPVAEVIIGKLSRGYRQRVAIAQALLNDPPILVLDEPTNALDAYQVIGVRGLIRALAGKRTVIVASHVLTEIEKVATRVMILRDGELLTADARAEASRTSHFRLGIIGPRQQVLMVLRRIPSVSWADIAASASGDPTGDCQYLVEGDRAEIATDLGQAVIGAGFGLTELVEEKPDLERVFLELTQRASKAAAA